MWSTFISLVEDLLDLVLGFESIIELWFDGKLILRKFETDGNRDGVK